MGYTVAVVGATGAVGAQMIKMLEESTLPIDKIRYLASARSAGKVLQFKGQDVTIEETTEDAFEGVDIALFSAGGSTSAKYAPYAVKAGAVVVDNTSYFRQNPDVPLVVPEVNAHALDAHNGIIACPNCSTIQMMVALEPVRQKWGLDRMTALTHVMLKLKSCHVVVIRNTTQSPSMPWLKSMSSLKMTTLTKK